MHNLHQPFAFRLAKNSYRSQASCRSAPRSKGIVDKIKTKRNGLWVSKGRTAVEDLVVEVQNEANP